MTTISFKTQPQSTAFPPLLAVWETADDLEELSGGWLFDHFLPINTEDVHGPCFEGWTALAFLAGRTRRLRLGLMVSSITYRHPALIANMAATLDVASGGRLDLGLGAGWFETEHRAYGLDFPPVGERLGALDEACEVIHRLLTEPVVTHQGRFYTLQEARCEPKPLQQPRVPLVVGGGGERRTLRTVARWADHWNFPGREPDELRRKLEILAGHCAVVGRDPAEIHTSVHLFLDGTMTDLAARSRALVAAGADELILYLHPPFDAAGLRDQAREVADAVA